MAIDGAGAQASNYSPRYKTTEKSEPARHDMLKIKSTYVKVTVLSLCTTQSPSMPFVSNFQGSWDRRLSFDKFSRIGEARRESYRGINHKRYSIRCKRNGQIKL